MSNKPDFVMSADAASIVALFEAAAVGETVSHKKIAEVLGRNIDAVRGAMATALRAIQRENRMVFRSVRGVGYIRLNDSEIVDISDQAREKMRRAAGRTARTLVCVDYDSLPKDKQTKHNAALSLFGAIAEISKSSSIRRLENAITITGKELPAAKAAIAAFGM
jgi:hypothetical protein